MAKHLPIITLLLFTLAFQCDRNISFPLNETFQLKMNEMQSNKTLKVMVSPEEVVEDSRCPKNTTCVWAGQVKIKFSLRDASEEARHFVLTLRDDKPVEAMQVVDGYTYQLMAVDPYPVEGSEVANEDYRITLLVRKAKAGDGRLDEQ